MMQWLFCDRKPSDDYNTPAWSSGEPLYYTLFLPTYWKDDTTLRLTIQRLHLDAQIGISRGVSFLWENKYIMRIKWPGCVHHKSRIAGHELELLLRMRHNQPWTISRSGADRHVFQFWVVCSCWTVLFQVKFWMHNSSSQVFTVTLKEPFLILGVPEPYISCISLFSCECCDNLRENLQSNTSSELVLNSFSSTSCDWSWIYLLWGPKAVIFTERLLERSRFLFPQGWLGSPMRQQSHTPKLAVRPASVLFKTSNDSHLCPQKYP